METENELKDWLTAGEAIRIIGFTRQALDAASKIGPNRPAKIRSIKKSRGTTLYHRSDVESYEAYKNKGARK